MELHNEVFQLTINPQTGALMQVQHPADAQRMNWVCDSGENPWLLEGNGWGLGFLAMPGSNGPRRWQRPVAVEATGAIVRIRYQLAAIDVLVTRELCGDSLEESYEFTNRTPAEQPIWGIGLYTPFNDNYPDAATCVARRCNAHLWCGGHVAYACCLRMGGAAPHLGLVLRDGFLGGYSIEGRGLLTGGSNIRGAFVLNANGVTLSPGQSHRIAWTVFWHDGWDDFRESAADSRFR